MLLQFVLREVYGRGSVLRVLIGSFTDMEYGLFFCVFALNVASVLIASYSVASSLYAVVPFALMIVHFNSTSILSLHNMYSLSFAKVLKLYSKRS